MRRVGIIRNGKARSVAVLMCLLSAGCNLSFQSKQYDFLKSLTLDRSSIVLPTWQLNWAGSQQLVYPISLQTETVFTDGDNLLIRFDGWNITRIEGLEGVGELQRIERAPAEMGRAAPSADVAVRNLPQQADIEVIWESSRGWRVRWRCGSWRRNADDPLRLTQACFTRSDSDQQWIEIENIITLSTLGMIESIKSTFDPRSSELLIQLR